MDQNSEPLTTFYGSYKKECVSVCVNVCVFVCVYKCLCVCISVCVCVCISVCACISLCVVVCKVCVSVGERGIVFEPYHPHPCVISLSN